MTWVWAITGKVGDDRVIRVPSGPKIQKVRFGEAARRIRAPKPNLKLEALAPGVAWDVRLSRGSGSDVQDRAWRMNNTLELRISITPHDAGGWIMSYVSEWLLSFEYAKALHVHCRRRVTS